jgi:hypothetical protein
MNPVDHPHGGGEGKTSGGRHPVSNLQQIYWLLHTHLIYEQQFLCYLTLAHVRCHCAL